MEEWRGLILLVLVTAALQVCRSQAADPLLVIEPVGTAISEPAGQGFVLTCRGTGARSELFTDMKWLSPKGEEITGNELIQVSKDGGVLFLSFMQPSVEDSGGYNCTAKFQNINPLHASIKITFYQDVTWEECPTSQALTIHKEGKIRCKVSANPPATVTWFKDTHSLMDQYSARNDGIVIANVSENDGGSYSIRAVVPRTGKLHTRKISVTVNVPPRIMALKDSVESVEGEEARLSCQASGTPAPLYQWIGPTNKDLGKESGFIVNEDDGTLIIQSVKQEYKGRYQCVAKNDAGQATGVVTLTVIVKPNIVLFENQTALEDGKALFECRASGDPAPKMTIRKDVHSRHFMPSDTEVALEQRREGDESVLLLTIPSVKQSYDGLYYCTAENKGGRTEKVGHLTVEYAPIMSAHPNSNIKTWKEHSVNLTCIAKAIPNATISWWFNGQEIKGTEKYYTIFGTTSESSLMVSPLKELTNYQNVYGTYKCIGRNPHGKAEVPMTLEEARVPSPLLQVTFKKITPTTITFDFIGPKDDGGLRVTSYVVEYREEGADAQQKEWSEGTPFILERLKPRGHYVFRFAAKNNVGLSEWTEDHRKEMPAEAAPAPPKFLSSPNSPYPNKVEVKWTIPEDNGRRIESFTLRYIKVSKDESGWRSMDKPVEREITTWQHNAKYLITGLEPASHYKIEVRARNAIGQSSDDTMIIRTAEDPSKGSQSLPPFSLSGTIPDGHTSKPSDGSLPWSIVAGIILVIVLVILLILDVTCYVRYHWGLLYVTRTCLCGRPESAEKAKEAAMEDTKGNTKDSTNNGKAKHEPTKDTAPSSDHPKLPVYTGDDDRYSEANVTEDTPMIGHTGAKDGKIIDANNIDVDIKNKSPKGSKSSIAKDSPV